MPNEQLVSSGTDICEAFNTFFASIGPNLASKIKTNNKNINIASTIGESFFFRPITPFEVHQELMKLNEKKAPGPENIPVKYIKMSSEIISPIVSEMFNCCVIEGVFPSTLKLAKVVPVFKNGLETQTNNYRPISLLSPFAKLFEKFILSRLNSFHARNNVVAPEQFGFRKHHSTSLLLADVVSHLKKQKEQKLFTAIILLDLKKAFDMVDHQILLNKLQKYGIRGNTLQLFESYLSDRNQYVFTNNVKSSLKLIKCGVPQGSILGPTLFSIYINDIVQASSFRVRLFADDTALIMSDKSMETLNIKVNNELIKITNWLNNNKLSLDYTKTSCLLISPQVNNLELVVRINGNHIKISDAVKYLGITLQPKLRWYNHINILCKKLSRASGIIAKLRHYVDNKILLVIYYSLVQSHLLYGILTWGSENTTTLKPLQTIQNKIVRIMCKVDRTSHVTNNSLYKRLSKRYLKLKIFTKWN